VYYKRGEVPDLRPYAQQLKDIKCDALDAHAASCINIASTDACTYWCRRVDHTKGVESEPSATLCRWKLRGFPAGHVWPFQVCCMSPPAALRVERIACGERDLRRLRI
jgi:hypothetical protein